jgi:hypothetical protein
VGEKCGALNKKGRGVKRSGLSVLNHQQTHEQCPMAGSQQLQECKVQARCCQHTANMPMNLSLHHQKNAQLHQNFEESAQTNTIKTVAGNL